MVEVPMVEVRGIERREVAAFRVAISFGFGGDLHESERTPEGDESWVSVAPLETMVAGVDQGRIVATFASFDFELAVPGGAAVPMAGATAVTVLPTHRRRGLLTAMMTHHLTQAKARGQVVAGLRASEETIYGRFGYGSATPCHTVRLSGRAVTLPPPPPDVQVAMMTADEAATVLPPAFDRHWRSVPGRFGRTPAWWRHRVLDDPGHRRHGASARRFVVAARQGVTVGWATYRQRSVWVDWVSNGAVEVDDIVALDDGARRALWHHLTHVDLYPNLEWGCCPLDDPLLLEVDRARSVTAVVHDSLWLRLLDPARAFEARRYEHDGAVTVAIDDPMGLAGGTWRLEVDGGAGRCQPVDGPTEVTITSRAAGAAYLGGVPVHTLARVGWVTGRPDAVDRLDALLRTTWAPHSPEEF